MLACISDRFVIPSGTASATSLHAVRFRASIGDRFAREERALAEAMAAGACTMQERPIRPPLDPQLVTETARINRELAAELQEHAQQAIEWARQLLARSQRFKPPPLPTQRQSPDW
jgi:hypothetical protein